MKLTITTRLTLLASALAISLLPLHSDPMAGTGYELNTYYTEPSGNTVTAFTWNSSSLYYTTADGSYDFAGLYKANSASPSSPTQVLGGNSNFAGTSLVSVGSVLFFNDGNNNIYSYDTTGTATPTVAANMSNYALFNGQGNQLFQTLATTSGTVTSNHIAYSNTSGTTILSNPGIVLETDGGASGPLAFDSAGDLYYAPGYGSNVIYKWTAAQVSAALLSPGTSPLLANTGSQWLDYSLDYSSYAGGTSMVIDNGQLVLTLTSFTGPSALVSFIINGDGSAGSTSLLASDDGSDFTFLSQLQLNNGNLFVADGSEIIEIVPEPSTYALLAFGITGLLFFHVRRRARLTPAAVGAASLLFFR